MSNNDDRNTLVSVLAGIGLGAIVGAAAGLLFAPKAGLETREDLKKAAEDLKNKAEVVVADLGTSIDDLLVKGKEVVDSTRSKVQQAVESGKQAMTEKKDELEQELNEASEG